MPCKSHAQAHCPYFHRFPNCLPQALGRSKSCSSCNKTWAERRAQCRGRVVWLALSIWKALSCLQCDSSGGILMHSLLLPWYHLESRGQRPDEPVQHGVLHIYWLWAWAEIKEQPAVLNTSMGGAWGNFSVVFRITQHLCRIVWKMLCVRHSLPIFKPPWVQWWKGLTGREAREFWRLFQIPGVPWAPKCWPLTL